MIMNVCHKDTLRTPTYTHKKSASKKIEDSKHLGKLVILI
jgi:hypothetical protein